MLLLFALQIEIQERDRNIQKNGHKWTETANFSQVWPSIAILAKFRKCGQVYPKIEKFSQVYPSSAKLAKFSHP